MEYMLAMEFYLIMKAIGGETFVQERLPEVLQEYQKALKIVYILEIWMLLEMGHAKIVEAQWLMLQQNEPVDFVIATGSQISVRDFVMKCAEKIGIKLEFSGEGLNEVGRISEINIPDSHLVKGQEIVKVDERYFRPAEVDTLLGDPTLAKNKLNWNPKISLDEMCAEMMNADIKDAKQESLIKRHNLD